MVVGISPDSVASHDRFAAKHDLEFPLLADTEHRVAEAYGVWKEKRLYGKTYLGIERSTFLIDPEGRLVRIWRGLKPEEHVHAAVTALTES